MEPALRFILGIASMFIVMIPSRYRQWWPIRNDEELRAPAIASGLIEVFVGVPGTTAFVAFSIGAARAGLGVTSLIFNPFVIFPLILAEGLVRTLAAISSAQILPTLPLRLLAWIDSERGRRSADRELGPLVPDVVTCGDGVTSDLCIFSCRAKLHWNPYITIRFDEKFYQMFREDWDNDSGRFVYFLRESPEWRLVVVVYEYHPHEVMRSTGPVRWRPQSG